MESGHRPAPNGRRLRRRGWPPIGRTSHGAAQRPRSASLGRRNVDQASDADLEPKRLARKARCAVDAARCQTAHAGQLQRRADHVGAERASPLQTSDEKVAARSSAHVREASRIFALSLAARRDIAPLHVDPSSRFASHTGARARSNGRNNASTSTDMDHGVDSQLSNLNMGHAGVSETGAENSILFYATVCLALICLYLVRGQSSLQTEESQSEHPPASEEASSGVRPTLDRAASMSRKTRRKDVYFLQGVGALTNPMSLDRLIHVAVHQGLNRSAWPLGRVLGKVLQQWARTLVRS